METILATNQLADALIAKLSKEELHSLCQHHDDGRMDNLFDYFLYEQDKKDYPKDYN